VLHIESIDARSLSAPTQTLPALIERREGERKQQYVFDATMKAKCQESIQNAINELQTANQYFVARSGKSLSDPIANATTQVCIVLIYWAAVVVY
jgi:hypothetical protein